MRITLYTSLDPDWSGLNTIGKVLQNFDDVKIVAVDRYSSEYRKERLSAQARLIKNRGIGWFISKRIDRMFRMKKSAADWNHNLEIFQAEKQHLLLKPNYTIDHIVPDTNGPRAAELIAATEPDVLILAGAGGIVKSNIFNIPSIATLNVHGAIAPKLRGGSSIFWSYYYGRPDWLGVTVHKVDKGIDTGGVYKREQLLYEPGIHPAKKLVESILTGADLLCDVLGSIEKKTISAVKTGEKSVYKSFYSSHEYQQLKNNNWHPVKEYNDDKDFRN